MQFNAHGDIVCRRCPAHESISQPGLVHGFLLTDFVYSGARTYMHVMEQLICSVLN